MRALIRILCLMLLLGACARPPDVEAVRAAVERGAEAARERDTSTIMKLVAEDFVGNDEFTRGMLRDRLRGRFAFAKSIGVRIGTIDVEVNGNRATARFTALVTDSSGRWLPDRAETLHFTTGWRREGSDWLCYNASWSSGSR